MDNLTVTMTRDYTEVIELLKLLPKEDLAKIPREEIEYCRKGYPGDLDYDRVVAHDLVSYPHDQLVDAKAHSCKRDKGHEDSLFALALVELKDEFRVGPVVVDHRDQKRDHIGHYGVYIEDLNAKAQDAPVDQRRGASGDPEHYYLLYESLVEYLV